MALGENLVFEDLGKESVIYKKILSSIGSTYEKIGDRQVDGIQGKGGNFYFHGLNNVGFSWGQGFADFDIDVHRQLSPDLFDDERWIVSDELVIKIQAAAVLGNLRNKGLLKISNAQLGAFAGINFKQSYRYLHFADSYVKGMTKNFDKLFLSFTKFMGTNYLKLEPYEFIQKQVHFSVEAGAMINIPLGAGISATAGALFQYHRLLIVDIQRVGEDDFPQGQETLRISYEKEKGTDVGFNAHLQIDFFKLLKVTLFSFDFLYQYKDSSKVYLSFNEVDEEDIRNDGELASEINRVIRGKKPNLEILGPNLVSQERRRSEKINTKYVFFIFGGNMSQDTQHIEIIKDGKVFTFFRHQYKKVKYTRTLLGYLASVLKLGLLSSNQASDTRILEIEYKNEDNLIDSKKSLNIDRNNKLSVEFVREVFAKKIRGMKRRKIKKFIKRALAYYTTSREDVKDIIRGISNGHITGPTYIKSKHLVFKEGINHFNSHRRRTVYRFIQKLCSKRSLFTFCRSKVRRSYDRYMKESGHFKVSKDIHYTCWKTVKNMSTSWKGRERYELIKKCIEVATKKNRIALQDVPLWRLKTFIQKLFVNSRNKADLYNFFGEENVFFYGSFQGQGRYGEGMVRYFRQGTFQGMGVVENFKHSQGLRAPASSH